MTAEQYHPVRTRLIRRDVVGVDATERQLQFRANASMQRLATFEALCERLEAEGGAIIDLSPHADRLTEMTMLSGSEQVEAAFEGTIFVHFGALPVDCMDSGAEPTGAYISAVHDGFGVVEGQVVVVTTEMPWEVSSRRLPHEALGSHCEVRIYDYIYDRHGDYHFRVDGQPGAFLSNEQTCALISVVNLGIHSALEAQVRKSSEMPEQPLCFQHQPAGDLVSFPSVIVVSDLRKPAARRMSAGPSI